MAGVLMDKKPGMIEKGLQDFADTDDARALWPVRSNGSLLYAERQSRSAYPINSDRPIRSDLDNAWPVSTTSRSRYRRGLFGWLTNMRKQKLNGFRCGRSSVEYKFCIVLHSTQPVGDIGSVIAEVVGCGKPQLTH